MEYLMPLWLRQYITQRQKRGTSEIPEDIAQHLLHVCAQALYQRDPATLAEPRNISVQQSFHRILHSTPLTSTTTSSSNHATPQSPQPQPPSSIRNSKFPFSSTPSIFKALGPRDMDTLNSQEIVRLAVYVMKRSSVELADPVLCEKVHTEGEKKRNAAASAGADGITGASGALKRVSSTETSRKGGGSIVTRSTGSSNNANKGSTNTNITASSIYLTKDFDIGDSVLHHRSKRPSRSLESVLSIATFCARASKPSARRASAGSSSGTSDNGNGSNNNNSKGGDGRPSTTAAAMVGARWLAKLGQMVFGGPCAQAGHAHHRRTRHSPDLLDPRTATNTNESTKSGKSAQGATAAPTEKLCKHCSGAMTCLAISILHEASSSSSSSTDSALSGQGRGIEGSASAKNLPAPPPVQDSGFESGVSGFELLDAQSDDISSDASSSSSSSLSSPTTTSSRIPSSETRTLRHGQSSHATNASREGSQRKTKEDYRPRLELKHKNRIRPRTDGSGGSTPRMAASPSPSGGSPYIIFDKSHQNDTVIRHPLQLDTSTQHQAGQGQEEDLYEEETEASESGAWSPSSALSSSLAEEFGPSLTAGGNWRSNMYASTGTRTPRAEDVDDDGMDSLPLEQRVKTRLERDLAEALGTPVLDEPISTSSSPFITQPAQQPSPPPQPVAVATAVPLVPSIRRPSITGLGIHAPVRSNSNIDTGSDDGEEEAFHQAIDHFIHPLSTSPHQRVSLRTTTTTTAAAPLTIPGASITPTGALTNAVKISGTAPSPTFLQPSPSNYSSPPTSPSSSPPSSPAPVTLVVVSTPTTDDVAAPLLPPASGDEEKKEKKEEEEKEEEKEEEEEKEGAESSKARPFYGLGIHGQASVEEPAQEVGEPIQKKAPSMDLGHELILSAADSDDDGEERKREEKEEGITLEQPSVNIVEPTGDELKRPNDADRPVDEVDDVDDVEAVDFQSTTTAATAEEEEGEPERRLSTLRYGGVGLHALTPSDEYVQDIEEAMQRPPPVDLSASYFDLEDEKEEDDRGETRNSTEEQEDDKDKDEDAVQTDDDTNEATTTVSSAIDRIEDDSLVATEAKSHIATALRYGVVGLHGKTPFDEYAHKIEESIQRGAQAMEGEDLKGERRSDSSDEEEGREVNAHKKDATNKPFPPSIRTRPLSSIYAHGPTTDSSFDYSSSSDNLDSYCSSNPSSPSSPPPSFPSTTTTPQTAVQKELHDLRRASQHRRKIQLVDDAQRKKEQLALIREQLERKALGKIREQVSFWETKRVLEQKVVGAEEVAENDDDGEDGMGGGEGRTISESNKELPGGLSLSLEHLRGRGGGGGGEGGNGNMKSSGEPISPGNSQSPGGYYSEMPQLATRRSLSTAASSTNHKIHSQAGSCPASAPEPSEIDAFLSNVD